MVLTPPLVSTSTSPPYQCTPSPLTLRDTLLKKGFLSSKLCRGFKGLKVRQLKSTRDDGSERQGGLELTKDSGPDAFGAASRIT